MKMPISMVSVRITNVRFYLVLSAAALFANTAAHAKDLYLSTNGSDSVSYAANDQANPWLTLEHALASIQGGDTLFIRGGTYIATAKHQATVSGTQANPTRITSFPGELATIDLSNVHFEWLALDSIDYWEVSDLEFVNSMTVMEVSRTFISTGNVFRNNRVTANRGGDNISTVRLLANARNSVIDGNEIIGPGRKADGINHNTSCVYMDRASNVQVLNNRLSNCVVGIHYKHTVNGGGGSNIEYAYNYITGTDEGIRYNGNNGYIHDNIFGLDSGLGTVGMENGSPGGDNNVFEHNTFAGGALSLTDAGGGAQNNVVRNNVFLDWAAWVVVEICRWTTCNHNTTLDFNLHPTVDAIQEYRIPYTLSQWRARYGGSASSIDGTAVLQGGLTPANVDDYRLAPTSPGVGAASDGTDMGARIDLFGGSGLSLMRPTAPQSLVVN